MDRRFEARKRELLEDCQVRAEVFEDLVERLEVFATPFVECFVRSEQVQHGQTYLQGLLSDLRRKNSESIAYRHDEDRMGLQLFIGKSPWDDRPLLNELAFQVGHELGEADGVISFDPSAFQKKGNSSAGVQRQWCGRLGKIENCQVGIFMGYASRAEQALVNMKLYLPKKWTQDKKRRKQCGVPKEVRYQTRHQLSLEMLRECGDRLPHAWVTGDDEMGRPYGFRRDLNDMGEHYLLEVPSNTLIRDQEADPPAYHGHGRRPMVSFRRVSKWRESLPENAWTQIEVRDGEKGPIVVEAVKCRVCAKTATGGTAPEEILVLVRSYDETRRLKHDSYLSNAPYETPLKEFARVSIAHRRIEQCIQRGKSEAGLADYQVRTWKGWHHHVTLSLIATWFLVSEARREKKMDSGDYRTSSSRRLGSSAACSHTLRHSQADRPNTHSLVGTKRTCKALSPQTT